MIQYIYKEVASTGDAICYVMLWNIIEMI